MPKKISFYKYVLILLILIISSINSITANTTSQNQINEDLPHQTTAKTNISIECSTYGLGPTDTTINTHITTNDARNLQNLLSQLQQTLYYQPNSPEIQTLQHQIITTAQNLNLLPTNIPKTILKPIKTTKHLPSIPQPNTQYHATEYLCNYLSFGEGSAMPVIVLPRLIPILLTPIPRIYFKWNAADGYTTCGGIRSGTGFQAYGQQTGTALGFWGIGFSIFLPPIRTYAILGYALHATVDAKQIELYPPNYPPTTEPTYPLNGATNIPLSTTEITFTIDDKNNDPLSYSITTQPNIGSTNIENAIPGIYTMPIHHLEGTQDYTWTIQITDGEHTVSNTYQFTTEEVAPEVSNPNPKDKATYISINTTELVFYLSDPQGDTMSFTVETSPNIGSGGAENIEEGTYSIPINNLNNSKKYTWYTNVTDGEHQKHEQFTFTTIPENVLIIYPSADTLTRARVPDKNYGTHTFMNIRNRGSGGNWEWDSLVYFDTSSIPTNISLLNAYVNLYYYRKKDNNPAGHEINLYRFLESWDEMTITWNNQPNSETTPSASANLPDSPGYWVTWDVTDDILQFLAGTLTNYGWKVVDDHYWGGANIPIAYFYTKENGDNIPYLEIQY